MVKTIFVDMDGVLADFDERVRQVFGKNVPTDNGEFWKYIWANHPDWFLTLPRMPDFGPLVQAIESTMLPVAVLSALPNPKRGNTYAALAGKDKWIKRNLDWPAIFCVRSNKKQYAAPGMVLIDDTRSNIDEWNAAGGIGIYHTSARESIIQLSKYVPLNRSLYG